MCNNKAIYRYTWPGRDESFICERHVSWLKKVANAMGFSLQVIPLTEEQLEGGVPCNQKED